MGKMENNVFGRKRRRKEEETDLAEETTDSGAETPEAAGGPYDAADAPDDDEQQFLDLGSLRIPALPGLKVGVASDDRGNPRPEVVISTEDSVMRLLACAAPRTEGIWDEVRTELAESLTKQGGEVTEAEGPYGTELRAKQPAGQNDTVTVRFAGIDGPRWFLRIMFQGACATDPEAAGVLDEVLSGVVVDRGTEAMPAREPLSLRLTPEMAEQQQKQQEARAEAPAKPNGAGRKRKPSPKPRKR